MTARDDRDGPMPSNPPLGPRELEALAERWSALPAMQHLGARADFSDPSAVRVIIDDLKPYHLGGLGTTAVNGAVIVGLCDAVIGMVGHLQAPGRRVATAQLGIQFIRPLHGSRVVATGRLLRAGQNLVFVAAEVTDDADRVCARADGLVAVVSSKAEQNVAL